MYILFREPSIDTISSLGCTLQDEQFIDQKHHQSTLKRVQVREMISIMEKYFSFFMVRVTCQEAPCVMSPWLLERSPSLVTGFCCLQTLIILLLCSQVTILSHVSFISNIMSLIPHLLSFHSNPLSLIPIILSLMSFVSQISCLLSLIFCLFSHIFCLSAQLFCLSCLLYLKYHVSYPTSSVSLLKFSVSHPNSSISPHVSFTSNVMSLIPYLFTLISHSLSSVP